MSAIAPAIEKRPSPDARYVAITTAAIALADDPGFVIHKGTVLRGSHAAVQRGSIFFVRADADDEEIRAAQLARFHAGIA